MNHPDTISEEDNTSALLNNKQYDIIKYLTVVFLPSVGTLYFALSQIWGLPYGEAVLGTLAAIQVFIGATMSFATKRYEESGEKYVGEINVTEAPDKTLFSLDLKDEPESLKNKDEAIFKVNSS